MKRALLAGAAALAFVSVPALAEDATQPAAAANDTASVGEIIVTAQHEKSQLSKTPISMSAVTGDTLRDSGVLTAAALRDVAPGISIDHTDGLQITIRGVTSTDQTEKGDPSAAFMLDGVYIARTQEADVSFFDVDRVEVLRGPQGTLYGRNTTAGVVNVITNRPKLGKLEGGADFAYGNYNAFTGQGFINLPAGETFALRAAIDYDRHDNYLKLAPGDTANLGPQRDNVAGRVQAYWEPSRDFNLLLRSDFSHLTGTQASIEAGIPVTSFYNINGVLGNSGASANWIGNNSSSILQRVNPIPVEPGIAGNGTTTPGVRNGGYSLEGEANWNVGPITLTDIASYRYFGRNETSVADLAAGFAVPDSFNGWYKQFSDEFRLSTNGTGPVHVQAGGYYFHEHEDIDLSLFGLLGPAGSAAYVYGFPQNPVINRTAGAFTQVVYKPVDKVRLTAGVRYTSDYKFRYGHTVILPSVNAPLSQNIGYVNDASIRASKVTWRAGVDADVASGLAYASVASGYKAGGFGDGCSTGAAGQSNVTSQGENCVYGQPYQTGATPQPQAIYYLPETLTAYEVGYKGKFADGHIRLNADMFYYNYNNLQLSGIVSVGGAPSTVTTNAGKASVKGAEIEATFKVDDYNTIHLGADLLNAHYTSYCGHTDTSVTPYVCDDNWDGKKLDRSPSETLRASYTLTVPVGDGRVEGTVGSRYMSSYVVTAFYAYPVQFTTPGHTSSDITVTYHGAGDRWFLQGYAKNLENFITVNGVSTFGFISAFGDPRTYGVRAGFKF